MTHQSSSPATEVLDFLNSIEGAGYGGMASFEIARQHARVMASLQPATPTGGEAVAEEEDAAGLIESDRAFAAQILADFGSFEEGITDQEKLAQWIRNVRHAYSSPDVAPSSAGMESAPASDLKTVLNWLKDPVTVHLNILRGTIAKPTWDQIKHLYPEQFTDDAQPSREAREKEITRLATIEECALIAEGFNSPRMKRFEEAGLVIAVYKRDGEIGAAIRALKDSPVSSTGHAGGK